MSIRNSNHLVNPSAREAMDKFKMEAASEVGVNLKNGYNGELTIEHFDDMWLVEGPWLQRLVATVNFSDYESRMFFDRVLREAGVFARMEEMGVKDGDTVSMYDLMFEYKD